MSSLLDGFLRSVERWPKRTALEIGDEAFTYSSLLQYARLIGFVLDKAAAEGPPSASVAVLAHKSLTAYIGILGTLQSGRAYVPLNPTHPPNRMVSALTRSDTRLMVVGKESFPVLTELLDRLDDSGYHMTVISPFAALPETLIDHIADRHTLLSGFGSDKEARLDSTVAPVAPSDPAYIMFTSGSTGEPKGVPVSHSNAQAYIRNVRRDFDFNEADRFSQFSDLTFDLSIHPIWVCWDVGGCLCVVPEQAKLAPARFIRQREITVWTSVPSVAVILSRLRLLQTGSFPAVRHTMFCGEPLPEPVATAWQEAFPNAVVTNYYGPTEATVAITRYPLPGGGQPVRAENGVIAIGWPFEDQTARLMSEAGKAVSDGAVGELWLSGSQVTAGYLNDSDATAEKYVRLNDDDGRLWYRTGDLARAEEDGCLFFVGRVDHQVKVHGHRIELQEVEHVSRKIIAAQEVACVAWPREGEIAQGIIVFAGSAPPPPDDEQDLLNRFAEHLPSYMCPSRIIWLDRLPLNPNDKVDRKALIQLLEQEEQK